MLLFALLSTAHAECRPVINELLPDALGADSGDEWVELQNAGESACDLTGWRVESAMNAWRTATTFDALTLGAGEIVLLGGAPAEVEVAFNLGNGDQNSDAVRLVAPDGTVADIVIYGGPNDDGWTTEAGAPASPVAAPNAGLSLGRCPDGADSDDNAADFVMFVVPTPGAPNLTDPCTPVDTGDTGTSDTGDTSDTSDTYDTSDTSGVSDSVGTDDSSDSGVDTEETGSCGCAGRGSGAAVGLLLSVAVAGRRRR